MPKTTLNKLKKNRCYCIKRDKDIPLSKCDIPNCIRFKSCLKKTNRDIDGEMNDRQTKGWECKK